MFLKNYTSDVLVSITIGRIEAVLIRCGVSGIRKNYTGALGDLKSIDFQIKGPSGLVTIQLPADIGKAHEALWKEYVNGDRLSSDGSCIHGNPRKKKRKAEFALQARKTAWKILQDWVEVQMSMIQLNQADTLQVFMPYIHDGRQSLYQRAMEDGGRMLQLNP